MGRPFVVGRGVKQRISSFKKIYEEHLIELERAISESSLLGSVIVLGDFNAHLGRLGGIRGRGETNVQGVLVNDMLARCHLNAVSLGCAATGPLHTFVSSSKETTVDCILADEEATSMLSQCCTLPMEDLNTSDHLLILADMMYVPVPDVDHIPKPNRVLTENRPSPPVIYIGCKASESHG